MTAYGYIRTSDAIEIATDATRTCRRVSGSMP